MSALCRECGKPLRSGAGFCRYCGAVAVPAAETSPQAAPPPVAAVDIPVTCVHCGYPVNTQGKFCRSCGKPLEFTVTVSSEPPFPIGADLGMASVPAQARAVPQQPSYSPVPAQQAGRASRAPAPVVAPAATATAQPPAPPALAPAAQPPLTKKDARAAKRREKSKQKAALPASPVMQEVKEAATASLHTALPSAASLLGSQTLSATTGNISFDLISQAPALTSELLPSLPGLGPLKLIGAEVKNFLGALKNIGKNKKGVALSLILAVLWLVLSLLPVLGIELPYEKYLSWLTFAKGGLQGGVSGFLGGVVGKGLLAGFLSSLFVKSSAKSSGKGGLGELKSLFGGGKKAWGSKLLGLGLAFVCFNWFTGNNAAENSVIGLVAALAALRSLGNEHSFIKRLALSFFAKKRELTEAAATANGFITAMALGFALAVPMATLELPYLGYGLGIVLAVAGLAFTVVFGKKGAKGAEA